MRARLNHHHHFLATSSVVSLVLCGPVQASAEQEKAEQWDVEEIERQKVTSPTWTPPLARVYQTD
jgi:hypothetical protein